MFKRRTVNKGAPRKTRVNRGFSLAEMMVVMLIMSIALAAATPIITKRSKALSAAGAPTDLTGVNTKLDNLATALAAGQTATQQTLLAQGNAINGLQNTLNDIKAGQDALHGTKIFTTSGSWTVPITSEKITVTLSGGGGGGGSGSMIGNSEYLPFAYGGGGGAPGCIILTKQITVTPGESLPFTIGTGGGGGQGFTYSSPISSATLLGGIAGSPGGAAGKPGNVNNVGTGSSCYIIGASGGGGGTTTIGSLTAGGGGGGAAINNANAYANNLQAYGGSGNTGGSCSITTYCNAGGASTSSNATDIKANGGNGATVNYQKNQIRFQASAGTTNNISGGGGGGGASATAVESTTNYGPSSTPGASGGSGSNAGGGGGGGGGGSCSAVGRGAYVSISGMMSATGGSSGTGNANAAGGSTSITSPIHSGYKNLTTYASVGSGGNGANGFIIIQY